MNTLLDILVFATLAAWLLPVGLMLLVAAVCSGLRNPLKLAHCWRFAQRLLFCSIMTSVAVGAWLVIESAWSPGVSMQKAGGALGLYPDGISVWMALMVSFIGWVILRFADSYLRADPARNRFLPWFLIIISSVLVLVFTNHLLILACAWVAISLALHQLLTLCQDRPQARLAAVQKFIVSRLGDVLVFTGVGLLYAEYGTLVLPDIIALNAASTATTAYAWWASVALALAAILKCAQIPFHGWLLRVMEAPTPVSALLHAGVINLGGFLWLRLFPVLDGFSPGHLILIVVGGTTAIVAVLTMMTQYSVKHALAWSTCAQMGFMLFEIGMGAYTLALVHLLAHSLYKAHSFLASGRTVAVSATGGFPPAPWRTRVARAGVSAVLAATIVVAAPQIVQHNPVLGAILVLAVAAAVLGIPGGASGTTVGRLALLAVALVPGYFLLHLLIGPALPVHQPVVLPQAAQIIGWLVVAALVAGTLLTHVSPRYRLAWYCCGHFRHGLYLALPFDRATRSLAARALRMPARLRQSSHHPFRVEDAS